MITICLRGGFGNRLFQIALGMHLENQGKKVIYDLSTAESRHNSILSFEPLVEYLKPRTCKSTKYLPAPFGRFSTMARILRRIGGTKSFFSNFSPDGKLPYKLPDFSLLDGYWQRFEYSSSLRNYMINSPSFRKLRIPSTRNDELYVHIRRGDFLVTENFLDIKFYQYAISFILNNELGIKSVNVITDDPVYCENFLELPVKFNVIKDQSAFEDFMTLVNAKYLLISRSTFSWWAARLGDSKIYYPTPWSPNKKEMENSIIPEGWVGIDSQHISEC